MGDVVSSHLDESKREMITGRTRQVLRDFQSIFEQQFSVALFNSVRAEIEGSGGTHAQLLHRKNPLDGRTIFSGSLLQYQEETRKWKNRYASIPNSYTIDLHDNKAACERGQQPKAIINCSGYKVLKSLEDYLELINNSLPGLKAKAGPSAFIKAATQYPLILWHPFARHHLFCVLTEKEHRKWSAVLEDCVRHANNGLPDESSVQTPAFTNSVRLYRQAQGHYGSWELMCGTPPQILSNLVMEELQPELRTVIGPRLRGKLQQRQRSWMLISGAAYRQVLHQATTQYEALLSGCEAQRGPLDANLRTNMDQIIASKEHVSNKIKAAVLPKAEQLLRSSVQPYVSSILEALMAPTSRGFSEVRDVFCAELVELSKNSVDQDKDQLGELMERASMLAFHPVKMHSCYEELERMDLEGLQQRFNVSSPSVFSGRAQILMREQMDNAVYTFEQLLNQSVEAQGEADLCQSIQKCQDRVLKKFDYDSSTVRKKFFREALLQIIVPYMLQELAPSCSAELPHFQELIFEDFSQFLPVENLYEEVVIQSVSKDIMSAVKEAAVQRRHNLFRDSIVLTNSDLNLHLLDENGSESVDLDSKFSAEEPLSSAPPPSETSNSSSAAHKPSIRGRVSNYSSKRRQVVSMIQLEGVSLPYESCLEVPEEELTLEEEEDSLSNLEEDVMSPDSINQIRGLINPVVEVVMPVPDEEEVTNGTEFTTGKVVMEDGMQEEITHVTTLRDKVPRSSIKIQSEDITNRMELNTRKAFIKDGMQKDVTTLTDKIPRDSLKIRKDDDAVTEVTPPSKTFSMIEEEDETLESTENLQMESFLEPKMETCPKVETTKSPQSLLQRLMGSKRQEEEAAIKRAIHELDIAVQGEEDSDQNLSGQDSDSDLVPSQQIRVTDYSSHDDSGFQSPTNERPDSESLQPVTNGLNRAVNPADVEVMFT